MRVTHIRSGKTKVQVHTVSERTVTAFRLAQPLPSHSISQEAADVCLL